MKTPNNEEYIKPVREAVIELLGDPTSAEFGLPEHTDKYKWRQPDFQVTRLINTHGDAEYGLFESGDWGVRVVGGFAETETREEWLKQLKNALEAAQ